MIQSMSFHLFHRCSRFAALFVSIILTVAVQSANAQQVAGSSANPYTQIAQRIGVTAYPYGTFDREVAMTKIDLIIKNMKGLFANSQGTQSQRLKYDYCNAVYADMASRYIATEYTLLTSLSGLGEQRNTPGIPNSQLAALYNEIVAQIQ